MSKMSAEEKRLLTGAVELAAALARAEALFAGAPHGVFVGRDGERAIVGCLVRSKRALRFSGPTFDKAIETAAAWRSDERNAWRLRELFEGA